MEGKVSDESVTSAKQIYLFGFKRSPVNGFMPFFRFILFTFFFVQTSAIPNHLSHAIDKIWAMMNEKWTRYPKLGMCRDNVPLLERFDGRDFCHKRQCLYSAKESIFVDLSKLTASSRDDLITSFVNYTGDSRLCHQPIGGQVTTFTPLVSYVITIFNHPSMVLRCLLELFRTANEASSAEFIVIDDNSFKNMIAVVKLLYKLEYFFGVKIKYVRLKKSHGYLAATNKGIRLAKGKYVVLLNSDVFVMPGWLHMLLHTMETYGQWSDSGNSTDSRRQVGIVGPLMLNNDTKINEAGGGMGQGGIPFNYHRGRNIDNIPLQYAVPVDYISAACILIRREVWLKYNLYDIAYYPAYYEDADAAVVLRRHGFLTVFQPYSVVMHPEGKTYSSEQKQKLMEARGNLFRNKHKEHFANLCPIANNHPQYFHEGNQFYRQPNRVLMLEGSIPEPDRDAGSIRLTEILHILIDLEYFVTLETSGYNLHTSYYLDLLVDGVNVVPPGSTRAMAYAMYLNLGYEAFMKANISMCPWQLIIMARRAVFQQNIRYIKTVCPNTPIIYDTVDVHYMREFRMFDLEYQNTSTHEALDSYNEVIAGMDLELSFMKQSRVTYVVSTEEFKQVKLKLPDIDIRILSNIYYVDTAKIMKSPENRRDAVFVGNFCHPPNTDAVTFIVKELLVDENNAILPDGFKVHVVLSKSQYCSNPILEAAVKHPRIIMHYDVSNAELLDIHNKAKVVLAPLRAGAGVKGKINYALLHGVPLIATPIAKEGMGLEHEVHALIVNTGREFAESISRLYKNDGHIYEKLQRNGIEIMKSMFGRDVARNVLQQTLLDVLGPVVRASDPPECPHISLFDNITASSRKKHNALKSVWPEYWVNKGAGTDAFSFPLVPNMLFNIHLFQWKKGEK